MHSMFILDTYMNRLSDIHRSVEQIGFANVEYFSSFSSLSKSTSNKGNAAGRHESQGMGCSKKLKCDQWTRSSLSTILWQVAGSFSKTLLEGVVLSGLHFQQLLLLVTAIPQHGGTLSRCPHLLLLHWETLGCLVTCLFLPSFVLPSQLSTLVGKCGMLGANAENYILMHCNLCVLMSKIFSHIYWLL